MPFPVHQLLNPACPIKPAWAVFDAPWFLQRYGDASMICAGQSPEAVLLYYLRVGARLGHNPSPLFDEVYYLARNPDIAALVESRHYKSGFDHFCQHGHRGVSPHWLFDDELYGNLYDDMTLENLDQHHCYGRYDHFLKSGQREQRMGHLLFDGTFYADRAAAAGVDAAEITGPGPFVHFLYRLGRDEEELAPSVYFEPSWYMEHDPAVKKEILAGRYSSGIHHYLTSDAPEALDPVPQFSESFYRRRHRDIADAIEHGYYRSAYQQFVQHGVFELRQPSAAIDLAYYRDIHEAVRNDLNSGRVRDAFAHLRLFGLDQGLSCSPPDTVPTISEAASRQQFITKAADHLALFARMKLDFTVTGIPAVTVVMVIFNRIELTMLSLASLRDNFSGPLELIIVDNDSADASRDIADYVIGAKIFRQQRNIGFLRACNFALPHVTAPALLFLNNDIELAHGAVAAALARLWSGETIGAVGGKIIRTNGRLQEAGSIIWNDGTTTGYMRDASPLAPAANFVRDVDYCSAVFLLCRTLCVRDLQGFDEDFAPAYFEDADLCLRMIKAKKRIVYDPGIVVYHLEFGSAATSEASMALMRRGRRIFRDKHRDFLATCTAPSAKNAFAARSRDMRPTVLFLEDTVPLRRLGSGFVRSNDIVNAIVNAGYAVHVFPLNGARHDIMSLFGAFPATVEILHDQDFLSFSAFLEERKDFYHYIWVARTHNFARILPLLRRAGIDPARMPIILDTEALTTNRDAARAALELRPKKSESDDALKKEFEETKLCRWVLAVNPLELAALQGIGITQARLLGTARQAAPTPAPFEARDGLLFVAGLHQADSPNLDSLHWYVQEIMPALAAEMGEAPLLHLVGYTAGDIDLTEFKHARIVLHGTVAALAPFYEAARVFIAPTRFAAGTPYKIYEAASFGVPCVGTDLLCRQLGWEDDYEMLCAPVTDAHKFAQQIMRLYRSEDLWRRVRKQALARLVAENGFAEFDANVADILKSAMVRR